MLRIFFGVDELSKKVLLFEGMKIESHLGRMVEKGRWKTIMEKILRTHVWKLISRSRSGWESKSFLLRHDNWFSERRGSFRYSPMSDVEKTKRSEKSLQPYRFLLNEWKEKRKMLKPLISLLLVELTKWWFFIIRVAGKRLQAWRGLCFNFITWNKIV